MGKLDDALKTLVFLAVHGYGVNEDIQPTKQQIKSLFLDLTNEEYQAAFNRGENDPVYVALVAVRKRMEEL